MTDRDPHESEEADDKSSVFDEEVLAFYDEHSGEVRGCLKKLKTPPEYIDGIVNDAFAAVRLKWATLRNEGENPRAYVFKVAHNQRNRSLRDHVTRAKLTVVGLPEDQGRDPQASAPDHADDVLDRVALHAAMDALPEHQREAVVLRKIYRLSTAEAAHVLNRPDNTIKSDLRRGLAALKEMLNGDEEANEQ